MMYYNIFKKKKWKKRISNANFCNVHPQTYLVPYAATIGDDLILMDDNCRPHCANLVNDFLL